MRSQVMKTFRKFLPPLSKTESEALESGTVGWDGELMSGHPDWDKFFALQKPELTAEEQAFLDGPVEELCSMIDTWQTALDNDLSPEVWQYMKDKGFFGLEVPKEYGGLGFTSQAHSAIVMKVSSRNLSAGVTVGVPNSLGPAELIYEYGTQAQKDHYLPRLAKGIEVPCFALTEPNAGSDAGSIEARGVVMRGDNGELGIRLNWEKRYITLGPVTTLLGLAFKLEDPDNLLGKGEKDLGITVALVEPDREGVEIGERHRPMDLPFQNGPNRGRDVFIPMDNVIGGVERVGHGWKMLMECLAVGRSLTLPAMGTAGAQFSCYTTGAYSRIRKQFNAQIGKFEGIEEVLGKMAGTTYLMNATRMATLQMVDEGQRPAIPSAILKYHLTERMRTLVNDAMDVHGGKAICNGPNNYFAELYKGIPVAITVEGANIMTRNLIIFGQGSVRAHPYLLKEVQAASIKDDDEAFKVLSSTIMKHAGNAIMNKMRSLFYGITHGYGSKVPDHADNDTAKYYRQINRLSASFAYCADMTLLVLGGALKFRERTSARLGDAFSNLYIASSVLWYYEKMGRNKEDLPLVHWACTAALNDVELALDGLMRNHPNKFFGWILRPAVFPLGRHFSKPSDKMDAKAADIIREPGAARDRLTFAVYRPNDAADPLFKLERALKLALETEPLEKKLHVALKKGDIMSGMTRAQTLAAAMEKGVLSKDEFSLLAETDTARRHVVMVDAFQPEKRADKSEKHAHSDAA